RLHLKEALLEALAALKRTRLVGRPGAELGIAASGGEIGIRFTIGEGFDEPLDADLAAKRLPVKEKGGLGIGAKLFALGTFLVGVESEALGAMALQENHPDVRLPILPGTSERHRVGIVRLALAGLFEPLVEEVERIAHGCRALRR